MSHETRRVEPILPGTTVAVFLGDDASAATVGYYGTLRGVCESTMAASDKRPQLWHYRIHVPALGGEITLPSCKFLVLQDSDGEPRLLPPADVARLEAAVEPCHLKFACPVANDNEELYGRFRFGLCNRGLFHFRKSDQRSPTYRLRLPVRGRHAGRTKLTFEVPAQLVLDQSYVLRTLVMILGCTMPSDSEVNVRTA
jgi:hypothetical protein